jgi:signal transduction histidine kinase
VPVLAALALALVHGAWLADRWDAVQTTTAMTVVMALVLRQFLALRDLRDLSHTLEERVRSRTRALEESQVALVRSQRLDAVGRMAAGIAHDFNNLLTIITAAVDYARLAPGDSPAPPPVLEEVEGAARRGTELVRQLLAFARRQPRKPRVFELLPALREVAPLLARLLGPEHQLVVATSGAGLFVEADPGQLEQVLVNLVTNARDAMTAGGTVRITVDREEAAGAEWVACAVQDTGAGLSAEAMAHLFEPFFTTKGARGTGLGLSSCYGIVSAAGGRIEVESEAGAGTTFRVLLPRAFAAREVPSTREAV